MLLGPVLHARRHQRFHVHVLLRGRGEAEEEAEEEARLALEEEARPAPEEEARPAPEEEARPAPAEEARPVCCGFGIDLQIFPGSAWTGHRVFTPSRIQMWRRSLRDTATFVGELRLLDSAPRRQLVALSSEGWELHAGPGVSTWAGARFCSERPAPEEKARPAPEEEARPAPEEEEAKPAPEAEARPAPAKEETKPAPAEEETRPAPPEEEARPAPAEEGEAGSCAMGVSIPPLRWAHHYQAAHVGPARWLASPWSG